VSGDAFLHDPFEIHDMAAVPPVREQRPSPARRKGVRAIRTAQAVVRMLPSEMRRAQGLARRAGFDCLSAWVRARCVVDDDVFLVLDEGTATELVRLRRDLNSGIGANLNQAMLHANTLAREGRSPDVDALREAVEAARLAVEGLRADVAAVLGPRGRA